MGRWYYKSDNREANYARINLKFCMPELQQERREKLIQKSLESVSQTFLESFYIWFAPKSKVLKQIRTVHGEAALIEAQRQGKGVILLCPHLGSWELLSAYGGNTFPLHCLYKPVMYSWANELIVQGRERFGAKLIAANAGAPKAILKALKKGEMVAILPDQEPGTVLSREEKSHESRRFKTMLENCGESPNLSRSKLREKIQELAEQKRIDLQPHRDFMSKERTNHSGLFVPFFRIPAWTVTLPAKLIQKTEAKVFTAYSKRLEDGSGFDVFIEELPPISKQAELPEVMMSINHGVEACIRDNPEQYLWSYKRFKSRPYYYLTNIYKYPPEDISEVRCDHEPTYSGFHKACSEQPASQ